MHHNLQVCEPLQSEILGLLVLITHECILNPTLKRTSEQRTSYHFLTTTCNLWPSSKCFTYNMAVKTAALSIQIFSAVLDPVIEHIH